MSEINMVGVVGAGTMGNGIAHVFAQYGFGVQLVDVDSDILEQALGTITQNLRRQVKKEIITEAELNGALKEIRTSTEMTSLGDADFVVEAATESREIKFDIFRRIDEITSSGVIMATNTSSISITEIAAQTSRPEQVIGMHFMNPVPVMKLVEVIRGLASSDETVSRVTALAEEIGRAHV